MVPIVVGFPITGRGPLGGPLLGLLGFLLMPAVWSVPEALVAAELATAFPSNGGYVTWVTVTWRVTKKGRV